MHNFNSKIDSKQKARKIVHSIYIFKILYNSCFLFFRPTLKNPFFRSLDSPYIIQSILTASQHLLNLFQYQNHRFWLKQLYQLQFPRIPDPINYKYSIYYHLIFNKVMHSSPICFNIVLHIYDHVSLTSTNVPIYVRI